MGFQNKDDDVGIKSKLDIGSVGKWRGRCKFVSDGTFAPNDLGGGKTLECVNVRRNVERRGKFELEEVESAD